MQNKESNLRVEKEDVKRRDVKELFKDLIKLELSDFHNMKFTSKIQDDLESYYIFHNPNYKRMYKLKNVLDENQTNVQL